MCVRASVVLMQCTLAHHIKFVSASYVKFHTLLNNNKGQIRLNLISHVFTLNMNFPGYKFLVEKLVLKGRNGTVFALRFCGPPSWMRERERSRIKSRPSVTGGFLRNRWQGKRSRRMRKQQFNISGKKPMERSSRGGDTEKRRERERKQGIEIVRFKFEKIEIIFMVETHFQTIYMSSSAESFNGRDTIALGLYTPQWKIQRKIAHTALR